MPISPPVTPQEAFALALQHHQAGRLAEAEVLYRRLLAAWPGHAEAFHHLGIIAHQVGHNELATQYIRQALVLDPKNPAAYSNLGAALAAQERLEEAIAAYGQAIVLKPDHLESHYNLADALRRQGRSEDAILEFHRALAIQPAHPQAWNNLGITLASLHRIDAAIDAYQKALKFKPDYALAHYNLGNALAQLRRPEEAIASFREALRYQPNHPEALNNLGNLLKDRGQLEEAVAAFRKAVELQPYYLEALNNLGNALRHLGRLDESIAIYQQALQIDSHHADTYNNLGNALRERLQTEAAVAAYRRAIELKPDYAEAHCNLGSVLMQLCQLDEALDSYRRAVALKSDYADAHLHLGNALREHCELDSALTSYRRAMQLRPSEPAAHSTLLYALQFHPDADRKALSEEEQCWDEQFSLPLLPATPHHRNARDPERPLRVGYISSDFRDHVVGKNILPLLRHHDRQRFQIFCYSDVARADDITEAFRGQATRWHDTKGMNEATLAQLIADDEVDILVDLAQHMSGNRLLTFARRPAPVQVSFAGYPAGTGLRALSHRISDRYLENDLDERHQLHLLESFWCYNPEGLDVPINDLPALAMGHVTFGSLNNFCKVNEPLLNLWARVLGAVPGSRLVLLSHPGSHCQRAAEILAQKGIEPERIEFVAPRPREAYLALYHRIDISLDPFPYHGHTTSLDSLWMGVPVVSLTGERPVSRAGLSQLSNLNLEELATCSETGYVAAAVGLASDLPELAMLRRALRGRMETSLLMDAAYFARSIETAYRAMWQQWCATNPAQALAT